MEPQHSSQARLLAPAALAVFAVAFFAILLGSVGGGDGGDEDSTAARGRPAATARQEPRERPQERGGTYTVKTGDTLGGIAQKTGVPVEQLQEINPELDPQALVSGQKIKLRE